MMMTKKTSLFSIKLDGWFSDFVLEIWDVKDILMIISECSEFSFGTVHSEFNNTFFRFSEGVMAPLWQQHDVVGKMKLKF